MEKKWEDRKSDSQKQSICNKTPGRGRTGDVCTSRERCTEGEAEQTDTAAAVNQRRYKKKLHTLTRSPLCLFLCVFSTRVCREAPQRQVCVSAPSTAAPSPFERPSRSLCSPELSETGRASPHSLAHRGRTYRQGSLLGLRVGKQIEWKTTSENGYLKNSIDEGNKYK